MKACYAFDRRGTVHEWFQTAVAVYFRAKCDKTRQVYKLDLQSAEHQLKGMPVCKKCYPAKTFSNFSGDQK